MRVRIVRFLAIALALAPLAAGAADSGHGWKTIHAGGAFTFEAPAGTVPYHDGDPIDSFVQQYRGPGFTMRFDYGPYSNDLRDLAALPVYHAQDVVIDGHAGVLVTGPGRNHWGCQDRVTAAYVVVRHDYWTGGESRFEIDGCARTADGIAALQTIFQTIRFNKE